jgi:hypothetical protein
MTEQDSGRHLFEGWCGEYHYSGTVTLLDPPIAERYHVVATITEVRREGTVIHLPPLTEHFGEDTQAAEMHALREVEAWIEQQSGA